MYLLVIFRFSAISDNKDIYRSALFENITESVFCKHSLTSKYCPKGKRANHILRPEIRCNDKFHVTYDENEKITKLVIEKTGASYEDYTIYANNDLSYSAVVCLTPTSDPTEEK